MKKTLAACAVAGALLVPNLAAPAFAAPAAPATKAAATTQAQTDLKRVNDAIATFQTAQSETPKADWNKEFKELFQTAFELKGSIETIIAGGVPIFDPSTIRPRVELVVQIAQTIRVASTDLSNKVEAAHVEIGFAITKAVLRLLNIGASVQQLEESKKEMVDDLARVSGYPDLGPNDTATIYVKARLDRKIWDTRTQRDQNILGKNKAAYADLNGDISKAVGVWFNPGATVAEVDATIAGLDGAYAKAAAAVK